MKKEEPKIDSIQHVVNYLGNEIIKNKLSGSVVKGIGEVKINETMYQIQLSLEPDGGKWINSTGIFKILKKTIMVKEKNFKSVYIHNGCRNAKRKPFKKLTFVQSVIKGIEFYIIDLVNVTMSLRDADVQKAAYHGKWYLETREHALANLHISLNDLRIDINNQLLNLFIKLAKKLNIYD